MSTKCILQVEDDEGDVFLLKRVFEQAGITSPLQTVTDGQMAIDYLSGAGDFADRQKHPVPCLVLMDLKLPRKEGLEVLRWIREHPQLNKLVVVMFSNSAEKADVERAYEFGANSYIQKPPSLEGMIEIAQLLKGWWLGYNHFPPILEAAGTQIPKNQLDDGGGVAG
jgi:CheY-like chemotaxis protein